jgi:hypothetical protein
LRIASGELDRKVHRDLEEANGEMGLLRKALFVLTGGLSGLVFKDDAKKKRTAKAAEKPLPGQKPPAATRAKAKAARRTRPQAARKSKKVASRTGTASELERLANLHRQGALSDGEFAAAKAKILGTSLTPDESSGVPAKHEALEANVTAARHLADLAAHDRSSSFATITSD